MSVVSELQPGDHVILPGMDISGVFIAQAQHPTYPDCQLVMWRLSNGELSADALRSDQEIGQIQPSTPRQRGARLYEAMR